MKVEITISCGIFKWIRLQGGNEMSAQQRTIFKIIDIFFQWNPWTTFSNIFNSFSFSSEMEWKRLRRWRKFQIKKKYVRLRYLLRRKNVTKNKTSLSISIASIRYKKKKNVLFEQLCAVFYQQGKKREEKKKMRKNSENLNEKSISCGVF